MFNILFINGSPKGESSQLIKIIKDINDKLAYLSDKEINIISINLKNKYINECIGCELCFRKYGRCNQEKDDIEQILEEMDKADLIVFSSPVYIHSVPSIMKKFLDRISYLTHLFPYSGKYGMIITTATSNGNDIVRNYLYKIMNCLGLNNIGHIDVNSISSYRIDEAINSILDVLYNRNKFSISESQNNTFIVYKDILEKIYKTDPQNVEARYWYEKGYFKFDNFQDVFNDITEKKLIKHIESN